MYKDGGLDTTVALKEMQIKQFGMETMIFLTYEYYSGKKFMYPRNGIRIFL